MVPSLYAHPFSSYCQKALIALYENGTGFRYRRIGQDDDPAAFAEMTALWPMKRFPVLADGDRTVFETTVIIEYLDVHHPGPLRLIPEDPAAALEARMLDRVFDNYVMTPLQKIVGDSLRPADRRDPQGVDEARGMLDTAYGWLDSRMAGREWAAGGFGLADCAAAPSLFYADWAHPLGDRFPALRRYRDRLLARPSFARAVDEARPFRHLFPLGAPDRD
ncbi:glutathione S-transferase family protein [Thalassobaculum sp.]|uniref:glutathione S-transferase family protein n=1 Tax=Thalassobaculum sp. TaxID=2022740 RepID=UPI0032EFE3C9